MLSLSGLNPPQQQAVTHGEGPLVVFAGAGSGKTRVITHRVGHLVAERGVRPYRVLAVTFTNKAAGELRERLARIAPGVAEELWVGTFHSVCARLLRRHAETVGLRRDFTIYDDSDQKAMITRVLRDLALDDRRYPVKLVAARINRAKQEAIGPAEYSIDDVSDEIIRKVYALYEERMQKCNALDFGDLIYRVVTAMKSDAGFRADLVGRFDHVLVDEFQDTNHVQSALVHSLAARHRNLCVVGDDDQSIYRWRGADRRNILDFRKHFPDATIIKLEQNYRSTQRILRVSHAVISRNRDREPKELWTDNDEGPKVLVIGCEDERDEAHLITRAVGELRIAGHTLSEMAVFYRTHAQSRVIEEALRASNVPYRIIGGMRFYDRAEVKDVLAYLRVIQNPDDDVSLLRIINNPARGIGKTTIERLLDAAAKRGTGVFHVMLSDDADLSPATRKKLVAFIDLVKRLRVLVDERAPISTIAETVLAETGYSEMLRSEDSAEADARLDNVRELLASMQEFETAAEEATLPAFLELVTLQTNLDDLDAAERLTLMTVHAAKGLEFDVVHVTGLEEEMFPLKPSDPREEREELEEERRLAYVAFTRARQRLVLSWAKLRRVYGQVRIGQPSRFIDELPSEDVTRLGDTGRSSSGSWRPPSAGHGERGGWGGSAQQGRSAHGTSPGSVNAAPAARRPASAAGEPYIDHSEGDFDGQELRPGMRVRHPKFGVGQVRTLSPGLPARVEVAFPGWGTKQIVATFLEPA